MGRCGQGYQPGGSGNCDGLFGGKNMLRVSKFIYFFKSKLGDGGTESLQFGPKNQRRKLMGKNLI